MDGRVVMMEVNAEDAAAFEMVINQLKKARSKWPINWASYNEVEQKGFILEESIELIQSINNQDKPNAKVEAAQYAVTAIRYLTGI